MILIVVILIALFFGFKIINKAQENNVETILKKGSLRTKTLLKGDIFHKGTARIIKDELSYIVYIRLEDGREFNIDDFKLYSKVNIGDVLEISKNMYVYNSQLLTFYSLPLEGFEDFRICEEVYRLD